MQGELEMYRVVQKVKLHTYLFVRPSDGTNTQFCYESGIVCAVVISCTSGPVVLL